MSLIVATRFDKGILLASDPFVFDNDAALPQKLVDFAKAHISNKYGCAFLRVGSSWVFRNFINWVENKDIEVDEFETRIQSKWAELNSEWINKRVSENQVEGNSTLRPISNSSLIIARKSDIKSISIIDHDGTIINSSTFIIGGSGSYLVEEHFRISGKSFRPSFTLQRSFDLIRECYDIASRDLYVIGYPTIVLVLSTHIEDFTDDCVNVWLSCNNKYFSSLRKKLKIRTLGK